MKRAYLDTLLKARAKKKAMAHVTDFATGEERLVNETGVVDGAALDEEAMKAVQERLRQDRSGSIETGGGKTLFVRAYNPPLRLIIIGAVHTAQALSPMAKMAGYDVILIDPRSAFATADRFPGVTMMDEWPEPALEKLQPDHRSAVVTLSHDPKFDEPAIMFALRSPAFYVGALGSRRTHASRCERLKEAGLSDEEIARIHGPVGLSIGALSPTEIAISILAQMTQVMRQPTSSQPGAK